MPVDPTTPFFSTAETIPSITAVVGAGKRSNLARLHLTGLNYNDSNADYGELSRASQDTRFFIDGISKADISFCCEIQKYTAASLCPKLNYPVTQNEVL